MDLLVLVYQRSVSEEAFYQELGQKSEHIKMIPVRTFDAVVKAVTEFAHDTVVIMTNEESFPDSWRVKELPTSSPVVLLIGVNRINFLGIGSLFDMLKILVLAYPKQAAVEERMSPTFTESLLFIERNLYKSDLTLEKVASHIFMSRYHYSRMFKQYIGTGFKEYVIQKRMKKAKLLLASGQLVTDVCYAVGYNDLTHFSRVFRKLFGVNPSSYRLLDSEEEQAKQANISLCPGDPQGEEDSVCGCHEDC